MNIIVRSAASSKQALKYFYAEVEESSDKF